MTEVAFHFNAPDKLAYACRLARKVQRSNVRLVIAADSNELDLLDRMLWNFSAPDFVAHCRSDAPQEILQASPVILTGDMSDLPHHEALLNLSAQVPEGFARFERLIEVVSAHDVQDRTLARARWKHYALRGYAITRHDLVLKADQ